MNSSYPESEPNPDNLQALAETAQDRAQVALQAGQTYVKENPLLIAAGAFVLGVAIGALVGHREPEPKIRGQAAREMIDDLISQVKDRLPDFKNAASTTSSLADQIQCAGKKLKWW